MCWRGWGLIPRAATGGFRTEVYGFCCGYLSRSRLNFSLLSEQDSQVDEQKPWLADNHDYVRNGDFSLATA
jgi:hypothetical protein